MAIDRGQARRRVKTITGWAAAGAAALTAGAAFGASRSDHVAQPTGPNTRSPDAAPQQNQGGYPLGPDQGGYPQAPGQSSQGFAPPSASSGPPAGMSGGS